MSHWMFVTDHAVTMFVTDHCKQSVQHMCTHTACMQTGCTHLDVYLYVFKGHVGLSSFQCVPDMPSKSNKCLKVADTQPHKYEGFWAIKFQGYNGTAGSQRLCILCDQFVFVFHVLVNVFICMSVFILLVFSI